VEFADELQRLIAHLLQVATIDVQIKIREPEGSDNGLDSA
jgi:hypothetical protein